MSTSAEATSSSLAYTMVKGVEETTSFSTNSELTSFTTSARRSFSTFSWVASTARRVEGDITQVCWESSTVYFWTMGLTRVARSSLLRTFMDTEVLPVARAWGRVKGADRLKVRAVASARAATRLFFAFIVSNPFRCQVSIPPRPGGRSGTEGEGLTRCASSWSQPEPERRC